MDNKSYRFKLGKFKCIIVSDGILIPEPSLLEDIGVKADQSGQNMDNLCLFIDTGKQKILVDTGFGEEFQAGTGKLPRTLEEEGISCGEIDSVIFTHGHADHVGGAFDAKGNPVYPRAHYFVSRKEWDCWVNRTEKKNLAPMFSIAREKLLPVAERFTLVEDNVEALPGIKFIAVPGHTPGGIALQVSSGNDKLLCVGDMLHSDIEFTQPEKYSFLDTDPQQAILNRNRLFSQAVKDGQLVFACHLEFPGLGRIIQKDGKLSWQGI